MQLSFCPIPVNSNYPILKFRLGENLFSSITIPTTSNRIIKCIPKTVIHAVYTIVKIISIELGFTVGYPLRGDTTIKTGAGSNIFKFFYREFPQNISTFCAFSIRRVENIKRCFSNIFTTSRAFPTTRLLSPPNQTKSMYICTISTLTNAIPLIAGIWNLIKHCKFSKLLTKSYRYNFLKTATTSLPSPLLKKIGLYRNGISTITFTNPIMLIKGVSPYYSKFFISFARFIRSFGATTGQGFMSPEGCPTYRGQFPTVTYALPCNIFSTGGKYSITSFKYNQFPITISGLILKCSAHLHLNRKYNIK